MPELTRAVSAINDLLSAVAEEEAAQLGTAQQDSLPWTVRRNTVSTPDDDDDASDGTDGTDDDIYTDADNMEDGPEVVKEEANDHDDDDDEANDDEDDELDDLPPLMAVDPCGDHSNSSNTSSCANHLSRVRRRQLELLAPLLDRLGRTLIDVAPHVASLAAAGQENDSEESVATNEAVVVPETTTEENPSTLGGLLSLLSRERRRRPNNNNENTPATNPEPTPEPTWPVDPDYVDFATGSVNTTRGEVRSGPRSRNNNNDDVAGLLGAYLAATSLGLNSDGGDSGGDDNASNILGLGRLLRERGAGGGGSGAGIDIHIHAVVTAPGMSPTGGTGGLGFATLGGGTGTLGTTGLRNSLTPGRRTSGSSISSRLRNNSQSLLQHHDDDGLFSELYSENPTPVDPNGSPEPDSRERSGGSDNNRHHNRHTTSSSDGDFLSRLTHPRSSQSSTPTRSSRTSSSAASPSRVSRTSSDGSSRRNSHNNSSPRRSSMIGRLFRRSRR